MKTVLVGIGIVLLLAVFGFYWYQSHQGPVDNMYCENAGGVCLDECRDFAEAPFYKDCSPQRCCIPPT